MTDAQRRAINRYNARKSTGPKTPEGKERTRQNALKHGLCAAHVVLPIENVDDLQAQFDEWIDHYQPVGPAEFTLVEEIARAQLKLRRCARREAAVVELQVRSAFQVWSNEQAERLAALQALVADDPTTAVRELQRFGPGRRWLLDRWRFLGHCFLSKGYCQVPALVNEAIRLLGMPSHELKNGPVLGFVFKLYNTKAADEPNQTYLDWLLADANIHPDYFAEHGRTLPDPEICRNEVRRIVTQQITALELEEDDWQSDEGAEAAGACLRAQIPVDGPDTRLALRYEAMARSALHKATKELIRLQDERYAAEAEDVPDAAPVPAVAPNEAEPPSKSPSSAESVPSCNASTDTNPDVPKSEPAEGCPQQGRAAADLPEGALPELPVVTPEMADSPPA